jgi:hypothetical protein
MAGWGRLRFRDTRDESASVEVPGGGCPTARSVPHLQSTRPFG